MAFNYGITYSFGVFFKELQAEFGWSRTVTSGVYSLYLITGALVAVAGGWALDRYGPRIVVFLMALFTGTSLVLTSQVQTAWHLYLSYGILFALGAGATYVVAMGSGSRWFIRKRGLALGLIGAGAGLGTMAMVPVATYLVSSYGWRNAFLALGIIAGVALLACVPFLKRDPGDIGALPDGETSLPAPGSPYHSPAGGGTGGLSLPHALRRLDSWLLLVTWFIYSYSVHLVMTHLVPHITDYQFSLERAASVLVAIGFIAIPTRILIGGLADAIGRKKTALFCALVAAAALFWLVRARELWMLFVFAAAFGIAYGGIDAPITALIGDIFGLRSVGAIIGGLNLGWGMGAAVGPALGGYLFDLSGSYEIAFVMGAAGWLIAAACIFSLKVPGARKRLAL
jgi:MFS family permease